MANQHQEGRWEAQAEDAARLSEVLHNMMGTQEITKELAYQIFAHVHGATEANEEFDDPHITL